MKWCPACGKYLPVACFPQGSGQCTRDRKAVQNLRVAAKNQGQDKWWIEVCSDPKQLQKVIKNYHYRCPEAKESKRSNFPIATYIEEIRQEHAILTDGVYEMMNERQFIHFFGKPKNGGIEAVVAASNFLVDCEAQGAITDMLGGPGPWAQGKEGLG